MSSGMPPTTFLFADIAGGARLWQHDHRAAARAVEQYEGILRDAISQGGGDVFKTVGDTVCARFADPHGAVRAALLAQRAIAGATWPPGAEVHARVALHSGQAVERGGDFFGPPVNQVARLLQAAHGGQTLLSDTVYARLIGRLPEDATCRDLGRHTLRDVQAPIRIFQLDPLGSACDFPPLATLEYDPQNLPAQMTSFIGRETEWNALRDLLTRDDIRLITLTGPGGVGKTRLALQLATESRERFPDGRFLVQLAATSQASQVARTIADTLDIREVREDALPVTISEWMADRSLLLILDNFEQVREAAPLVGRLLAGCSRLTVLVTSRVRLRLTGEQEYEVPPLTKPAHANTPIEELARIEAVQLFVNRARATRPQFALTAANAPSLAGICQRLDGLPLAIELAAARSKRIPPERMLDQLDDRFGFLTQGSRDLPPRQQALRAAIDWSFDLLSPEHQALFQRLGIFAGGFTLDAAEEVLNPAISGAAATFYDVLDGVSTLVDNSLLQVITAPNGDPRYLMLETIRAYARQRLTASGEFDTFARHHANWMRRLARESRAHWRHTDEIAWLARLETETDNLRAALDWLAARPDPVPHVDLTAAIWWFWTNRGHLPEGRAQLERALARSGGERSPGWADALTGAGVTAYLQGDWTTASGYFAQALPRLREAGDDRGLVRALNNAGNVALLRDDPDVAAAHYDEALDILRRTGDKAVMGIVLSNLGRTARHQGSYDLARRRFAEAIAVQEEIGEERGRITTIANLADLLFDLEQMDEAEARYQEARDGYAALNDRHSTAYALERLAQFAIRHGDWQTAQSQIDEALAIFDDVGDEDGTASMLLVLAELQRTQGDPASAAGTLVRALDLWRTREVGSVIAPVILKLAVVASATGQHERAARLLGAVGRIQQTSIAALSPRDQRELDEGTAEIRSAMDSGAFGRACAAGRELSEAECFAEARRVAGL
jgi:predicted ATPase/class 3 adenylate cyclase